ncbi:hypothetical protein FUAX_12980 [Fulvitalea axinellae]|uniref:Restriction endonuclease type IV Mrr domain-containing protein n=1 Tax=Fulvitalea axinellae TaxID=1182444 RepID=A0AAU9CIX0_9BACT|nr:hypothetical protein FUAX_12980 [Fulvitalea axinellae]
MSQIPILKSNGETVEFSTEKLEHSLLRAGANESMVANIIKNIVEELPQLGSTAKIYKEAYRELKRYSRPIAAKYKLKRAIMQLGPSGFPFERYIGEILSFQGYNIQMNPMMPGKCVRHEIDVLAENDKEVIMVECKYRNRQGYKTDVKVPLYVHSRFRDVRHEWLKREDWKNKEHKAWIATNTRFTEDAIKYAKCEGMRLLAWDYPQIGNLRERIDLSGLYPLTCLTTLTKQEKTHLLQKSEIVLCRQVYTDPETLDTLNLPTYRKNSVLSEVEELLAL